MCLEAWSSFASYEIKKFDFFLQFFLLIVSLTPVHSTAAQSPTVRHYLYVAVPGIRDYLGYGGHGILVFDIDSNHRFVKRIDTKGFHPDKTPSNVKGIAVSIPLNSIYISTNESLQRIDLSTEKVVWEKFLKVAATACRFRRMARRCIYLL